jgi:hypothetical protein
MTWPNDRARCTGDGCIHLHHCARHAAHVAVRDQPGDRRLYIDPRSCIDGIIDRSLGEYIEMPYSHLVRVEKDEV